MRQINYKFSGEKYETGGRTLFIEDGIPFLNPKMLFKKLTILPPALDDHRLVEALHDQLCFSIIILGMDSWMQLLMK